MKPIPKTFDRPIQAIYEFTMEGDTRTRVRIFYPDGHCEYLPSLTAFVGPTNPLSFLVCCYNEQPGLGPEKADRYDEQMIKESTFERCKLIHWEYL